MAMIWSPTFKPALSAGPPSSMLWTRYAGRAGQVQRGLRLGVDVGGRHAEPHVAHVTVLHDLFITRSERD